VSAIVVRPFRPDDAAAVATALVDSSIQHVGLEPDRYEVLDPEAVAAMYRAGRQHSPDSKPAERVSLVGELDGVVVGILDAHVVRPAGAHIPEHYGYVAELAVSAAARRHGVGAALLRAAEDWAREAGCAWTVLDYNAANHDAGRFYRDRMGYRSAGAIVVKDLRGKESGGRPMRGR
jgi:GNAT superfamily N-acetyltransferase